MCRRDVSFFQVLKVCLFFFFLFFFFVLLSNDTRLVGIISELRIHRRAIATVPDIAKSREKRISATEESTSCIVGSEVDVTLRIRDMRLDVSDVTGGVKGGSRGSRGAELIGVAYLWKICGYLVGKLAFF